MTNTHNNPNNNDELPTDAPESDDVEIKVESDELSALEQALADSLSEDIPEEDEVEELPKVTVKQLVDELKDKHYRALVNEDDRKRLDEQLSKGVINPIMLARYLGIQPQMVYGAIRDGKLSSVKENNTQKLFVTKGDALRWAAKYLTGKQARDAAKAMKVAIETAGA
jgi:hypothetical protein